MNMFSTLVANPTLCASKLGLQMTDDIPFPIGNVWRESRRLDRADGRLWVSLSQTYGSPRLQEDFTVF
ncbi:hypothetical protein [Sphingomonas sp. Ant20]|uniref:hypothetical protein n=1 Tax=Sphingomonas sp. Ant20 TaxID=104605 RepID=UPI000FE13BEB|nr:hypothetical protein [Sphingomonas sp. Ant20]